MYYNPLTKEHQNIKRITRPVVERKIISLAARKMNLDEVIRKYRSMIRKIIKKTNIEPDLVRDDRDRIN